LNTFHHGVAIGTFNRAQAFCSAEPRLHVVLVALFILLVFLRPVFNHGFVQ